MDAESLWWAVWYEWIEPHVKLWILGLGVLGISVVSAVQKLRVTRQRLARAEDIEQLAATAGEGDLRGKIIGGYLLRQKLGGGHATTSYRAEEVDKSPDGPPVVMKIFNESWPNQRKELGACGRLHHPGLPVVLASGDWDGHPYVAMACVEGTSLKRRLQAGAMPIEDFVPVFKSLVETFRYAHDHGVCHRDLKPSNIMLQDTHVQVLDFGMSQPPTASLAHFNALQITHNAGSIVLTYMAPEQLHGKALDARSDQYSLGVIGYEMLSGRRPVEADLTQLLKLESLIAQAPRLETLCPHLPKPLCDTIHRMMAADPEARFPNLSAALASL